MGWNRGVWRWEGRQKGNWRSRVELPQKIDVQVWFQYKMAFNVLNNYIQLWHTYKLWHTYIYKLQYTSCLKTWETFYWNWFKRPQKSEVHHSLRAVQWGTPVKAREWWSTPSYLNGEQPSENAGGWVPHRKTQGGAIKNHCAIEHWEKKKKKTQQKKDKRWSAPKNQPFP